MTLDVRDRIIQEHAPTVMAPSFTPLPPLGRPGHRFIVEHARLSLEVVRPWLHLVWPITEQGAFATTLPYGLVEQRVSLAFKLPKDLLQQFLEAAKKCAPFEHAAWFIWNDAEKRLEYRELDITEFGNASVTYHRPALAPHESLAVDLHSHGEGPAGFSAIDDADDAGEVKVSVVVGNLREGAEPSWALRLCALGVYLPLPSPKGL